MLRSYGLVELRSRIRNHIQWAKDIADKLRDTAGFEIVTEPILSLFTFRYLPDGTRDPDTLNQSLVDQINDDGRIYLTQTNMDGCKVIRFQVGQFETTKADVDMAYQVICETADHI